MESIVMSQKKFRASIFYAFSHSLMICGQILYPWTDDQGFGWAVEPWGYYHSNGEIPRPEFAPTQKFSTHFGHDNPCFRSMDAMDMVYEFGREFKKFKDYVESEMTRIVIENSTKDATL